jgi:hypothetical protein
MSIYGTATRTPARLMPLLVALLIGGCAGLEPYEHRDEREEGPRAGLISGEAGEFVIFRRSDEQETSNKAKK